MRVITGSAKGKRLETLSGVTVRPTTDRVKEAIFSAIQFEIDGKNFLDLFAGSGQMAIEALSRGALNASLVDSSRESVNVIKKNLELCKFYDKAEIFNTDYFTFLKKNKTFFDIAFLDPPYKKGILQEALPKVSRIMNKDGIIICEHPNDEILPEKIGENFNLCKKMKYGKIIIEMFRKI